ncbi:hypothetical protein FS842_006286 [Serendipita sp. 407]|nr:hypothetical protein FS842_006286 [Serendipita sp. 407]
MSAEENIPVFPELTIQDIFNCQISSWYPKFSNISMKTTIIRPLPAAFREYLQADGVFPPIGSNDSEDGQEPDDDIENSSGSDESLLNNTFSFPDLDKTIRTVIEDYGAVFPKLNWSSPKDAQWILSTSEFLRCSSPADVYLSLKASDFIHHDLDPTSAFEGIRDPNPVYDLELALRKWYHFDRSREMRCFVRDGTLIGISQRDAVYYDFLFSSSMPETIMQTIQTFWERDIRDQYGSTSSYVVDVLLTRDFKRLHIVDFNPFIAKTDPLLFTYDELRTIFISSREPPFAPVVRIIDNPAHPYANVNAPRYQHNMVPLDALALSHGRNRADFANALAEAVKEANSASA